MRVSKEREFNGFLSRINKSVAVVDPTIVLMKKGLYVVFSVERRKFMKGGSRKRLKIFLLFFLIEAVEETDMKIFLSFQH